MSPSSSIGLNSNRGGSESRKIKRLLSHVRKQFDEVEVEFERKYGHLSNKVTGQEDHPTTRHKAYNLVRFQRLDTAPFTGSIFHKHMQSLEDNVNLLLDISEKRFVQTTCEVQWKDRVGYIANRTHLCNLADQSSATSKELRELMNDSQGHSVDFCLDHGTSPHQRQTEVLKFASECRIPYYLCLSVRHSSSEWSLQGYVAKRPSGHHVPT